MKPRRLFAPIALLPALLLFTYGQQGSSASTTAVLYTPNGALHGTTASREFFVALPGILPPGFWENFKMVRQDVDGQITYIVWASEPAVPLDTDTFVIRNGQIVVQTFAAHMVPSSD